MAPDPRIRREPELRTESVRQSGWILAFLAIVLWWGAIGLPLVAAASMALLERDPSGPEAYGMRHAGALWRGGLLWALGVGATAALLGWGPGRLLRALLASRPLIAIALGMLLIVPTALPAYLGSWCWWQLAPSDSPLHAWIVRNDHMWWLRRTILALGLVGWSWPLAAWSVAGLGVGAGREVGDALRLDGASRWARLRLAFHEDRFALLIAALLTGLFAFGNTTAFDLALVRSFGFELRTLEVRGAGVATTIRAALPATLTALVVVVVAWRLLATRRDAALPDPRTRPGTVAMTSALIVAAVAVPVTVLLFAVPLRTGGSDFMVLYGRALQGSLSMALLSAAGAALVAAGTLAMSIDRRRSVRAAADAMLIGWAVAATVPAIVVATAFVAAYNRGPIARALYDSPMIVALGHLACFGLVAALLGRQAARAWPASLRDQAQLDGAGSLRGIFRSTRPAMIAAAFASAALVAPMSLGEVVLAGRLQPPGYDSIASALLNAVHYQRPETVMIGALAMLVLALAAGAVVPLLLLLVRRASDIARWGTRAMPTASALLAAGTCGVLGVGGVGCVPIDPESPPPIPTRFSFGRPGVGGGQFDYPRAIAVDAQREWIYVIDKTARIQRFGADGTLELTWRMPEWEQGKPVGLTVAPDGSVWVADTHYYRVVVYEPTGIERMRFGRFGQGPGEFIYPTDVAIGADLRVYVSEYGGNDRIQIFDFEGNYLSSFGTFGNGPGEFNRPQALAFSADGAELFIADSCNHRIVVTDPSGRPVRSFGRIGSGVGELGYPYGIEPLADGTLVVMEFGNSRMQRFSSDGRPLGMWGGLGFDLGRMRSPWGVAATSGTIFLLDSGNHRVQTMRRP